MNKKWQIFEPDKNKIEEIKSKYKVNQLLATILANRNILKEEDIRLFLNPTRNDFYNPFLITDMDIAVNRIIKAIENKENITMAEAKKRVSNIDIKAYQRKAKKYVKEKNFS